MSKMASSLNESNLEKKLSSVTNTQESIQTLSLWCIHHRAHHRKIVDVWMKVLKKSKPSHRLALYYLANDVIQNSKRKNNSSFADSWGTVLKDTIPLCRDEKIKNQVERILTIWEQRNIYDTDFIENLKSLFSHVKTKAAVDSKLVTEFKPQKLIEKIKKVKKAESESDIKQKQLNSMKIDVSSSETLRQLKDRANGDKFSKEFEDATAKLAEYVDVLDKEFQERKSIVELLDKAEKYYGNQRGEAKIVANAYKNFGSRVKNLKKKLTETKNNLPSPLPSPTHDAPSPIDSSEAGSPKQDVSKDNTEAVDMEMSDEETSGTLRLEDPGSPESAPSPEGSPIGLNIPSPPKKDVSKKEESRKHVQNKKSHSTQGPNAMTSLIDSMSGSMSASSRKGSLESRLSNFMQMRNLSSFSPTIDSGLFDDPNSTPPIVHPLSTTTTAATNDGGGTPLKDEGSGTGSATPLQDEEREASHCINVRLFHGIISKGGNNSKVTQYNPSRDSWNARNEMMEFQSKQNDDKLSISEFLNKIGGSKSAHWPSSKQPNKKQQQQQQQHQSNWFPTAPTPFTNQMTSPPVPSPTTTTNQYNYSANFEPGVNPYGFPNSEYFPDDQQQQNQVANTDALLSPTLCRPMKRNPNIVELTPSPTAVFGGNDEIRTSHSNLITVVQNNANELTSYQPKNSNPAAPDRIRFTLKPKQGPSLIATPNRGFTANTNNLRLVTPSDSNGKQVNDDLNENDELQCDVVVNENAGEEISRIESLGHRNYESELYSRRGEYDNSFTHPSSAAVTPGPRNVFNWQENWDARSVNSFESTSFFPQQRFSFNPPPKRFPHPRFDGRRPPFPPRF